MKGEGEPAARCAAKDESPLTSVRGRGHSSHLVCRTSGFLLLSPPPPSPSRLHGGFLSLPLQKATDPEWRVKGWQLECFLALSFTLTLILLQCYSLYLLFRVPTPACLSLLIPPLPFNFSPSFFFFFFLQSIILHTPSPHYGSFPSSPPWLLSPSPRLPAPLLLSYLSVQAEGKDCAMQETGSQIHPCCSSFRKMSRHFLFFFF